VLAHLLDEREHAGTDHDVVEHFGARGHLREVLGERRLRRRDRHQAVDLAAQLGHRLPEEISVVVAEGVVREDHRDLLPQVLQDEGRQRGDLRADVGDARLEGVAVHLARGHVVAFADDQVGDLQLAGARRRRDDDVREESAEDEVHLVLLRQLLDDLDAPLGIGPVVLSHDLHGPARDAAFLVDQLDGRRGRAVVPLPVRGADPGAVHLEPNPQRASGWRGRVDGGAERRIDRQGADQLAGYAGPGQRARSLQGLSPGELPSQHSSPP